MTKIKMNVPLVELDGDEMTRVLWKAIKEILIEPFVDLNTVYFDLGLPERERTGDKVTAEAAEAIKKYGVGVKCATITPNAQRVSEYNLTRMWKSPNGTIRAALDGTVFRAPVLVNGIKPLVPNWTKPITIARHAYGDVYSGVEAYVPEGGKVYLELPNGDKKLIKDLPSAGIIQAVHNLDKSIAGFARSCFNYALSTRQDLWFSTKDTISKTYDHRFKDIFAEIYESEYRKSFEEAGIEYFYTLIDDAVARVMRSKGGFIWACKNYDGDVMSDMLATAFGSLAMMTSVLVSKIRIRGGARHRYQALLQALKRRSHFDEFRRDDIRLDGRIEKARRIGRERRIEGFCGTPRKSHRFHDRIGNNDGRPRRFVQPRGGDSRKSRKYRIPGSRSQSFIIKWKYTLLIFPDFWE